MFHRRRKKKEVYLFATWIGIATKGLFPPDQKAVRRELYCHMDDKRDRYLAMGYTLSQAKHQVLEDMGDPEETSMLLRAVHNPWLGWGLRLARCVSLLLLFGFILMLWTGKLTREDLRFEDRDEIIRPLAEGEYGIAVTRRATWTDQVLKTRSSRVSCAGVTIGKKHVYARDMDGALYTRWLTLREPEYASGSMQRVFLRYIHFPWSQIDWRRSNAGPTCVMDQAGNELLFSYEYYHTRPWETIVVLYIDQVDLPEVELLDVYFDNPDLSSEYLRICLGDYEVTSNLLPMADVKAGIEQYYKKDSYRCIAASTTEPVKLGDMEAWIDQTMYPETESDFWSPRYILMIRGSQALDETIEMYRSQNLGLPGQGDYEICVSSLPSGEVDFCTDCFLCSDGVIYTIHLHKPEDARAYLLQCTIPSGESCVFTLPLDEEGSRSS